MKTRRQALHGTADRPRLAIEKTNRYLRAQLIDDDQGITLAAAHDEALVKSAKSSASMARAAEVGTAIAKAAAKLGITAAVFDRRAYAYHGKVSAVADAARAAGLKI